MTTETQAKLNRAAQDFAQRHQAWSYHAHGQLMDAVKDAKACGLGYEETMQTALDPPDDCKTIEELTDYTVIIQKYAAQPWFKKVLKIEATFKGALRQRFALAHTYIDECKAEDKAQARWLEDEQDEGRRADHDPR